MRLIFKNNNFKYYTTMYGKYKRRNPRARKSGGVRAPKKTVKKAIRTAKRASFARAVTSVINRKAESKVVNYFVEDKPLYNVLSADWDTSVLNLLPQTSGTSVTCYTVSQGELDGQRIGCQIMPVSLKVSGVIRCNPAYDATVNYNPAPLRVTMWLVKLRKHLTDSVSDLETIVQNTFFENGSTSIGMVGTNLDIIREVNNSQIDVLFKRTFKVGMGNYVSAFAVNSPNNINNQYNNNDFNMSTMFKINLSKYLPKKLVFNDGTDTPTSARKMWCMFTVQRADSNIPLTSAGSTTGPIPAFVDFSAQFEYKDY